MVLNLGYIGGQADDVSVRIYYDNTGAASRNQSLKNGPLGFAFEVQNPSDRTGEITVTAGNFSRTLDLQPGTWGYTLTQLRALNANVRLRGNVGVQIDLVPISE